MPKTMMGVTYDIRLNAVRSIIVPDDDRELLDGRHARPGEGMVLVSTLQGMPPLDFADEAVQRATGRAAMSQRDALANDAMVHSMGGIRGITLFT